MKCQKYMKLTRYTTYESCLMFDVFSPRWSFLFITGIIINSKLNTSRTMSNIELEIIKHSIYVSCLLIIRIKVQLYANFPLPTTDNSSTDLWFYAIFPHTEIAHLCKRALKSVIKQMPHGAIVSHWSSLLCTFRGLFCVNSTFAALSPFIIVIIARAHIFRWVQLFFFKWKILSHTKQQRALFTCKFVLLLLLCAYGEKKMCSSGRQIHSN